MRRRAFLGVLGGAAIAWPFAARAQERVRVRRVGVLMPGDAADPQYQERLASLLQGLSQSGWMVGQNLRVDTRWGAAQVEGYRALADELFALEPDVVVASGGSTVQALRRASRTVPIVFANVTDPVGAGLVASLARPGGNATGFAALEFGFGGKWLELLKDVVPRLARIAVMRDAAVATQTGMLAGIQSAAHPLGIEVHPIDLGDASNIESVVAEFAKRPNGGLIVPPGAAGIFHRKLIFALAARHRLPAIYPYRAHVAEGGLMAYGIDNADEYRNVAAYVDRILKGEKPADLPVQNPTKYVLAINLKTAKALGLAIPPALIARADEVIE